MKNFGRYVLIFFVTLFILFTLLVLTAKIPKNAIKENIKESTSAFKTQYEIYERIRKRKYTFTHPYADAMWLNIIYCTDTSNALKSVMEAKYYVENIDNPKHIRYNFDEMVENDVTGNIEYLRYWHGQISILRPLLVFFNLNEIYVINEILFYLLLALLIIILIKKKHFALLVSFLIGMVMCAVTTIPLCMEYSTTFDIMLIASIIAIFIEKNNKKLNALFLITGILTIYFDFLTTEIITLGVPLIIVLAIRYKEQRLSFKQAIKTIFISSLFWLIGYVGMWLCKWILASLILNIDAMEFVKEHVFERLNGDVIGITPSNLPFKAIKNNFFALYPLGIKKIVKKLAHVPIIIGIFVLIFIKKKNIKKELWFSLLLLIVATMPYIRYFVMANHSYKHDFFTFRCQIISIMAVTLAIIYSLDKNIIFKEIKIKKKNVIGDGEL